jgi:hypothetical protein
MIITRGLRNPTAESLEAHRGPTNGELLFCLEQVYGPFQALVIRKIARLCAYVVKIVNLRVKTRDLSAREFLVEILHH